MGVLDSRDNGRSHALKLGSITKRLKPFVLGSPEELSSNILELAQAIEAHESAYGARVTALNGDNYDCIEVNAAGDDIPDRTHTDVKNLGAIVLEVNKKYPLLTRNGEFFFAAEQDLALTVEELDGTPSVDEVKKIVDPSVTLTDDGDGQVTLEGLTVEEADASPSVENVKKIIVPSGTLTDDEDGQVTLEGLTVAEVDADPSVSNVKKIVVSNGTLTDDGNGQVTVEIATDFNLIIKESDSDPLVSSVDTIVVPNGSLTDDGGGQVTIDFGPDSIFAGWRQASSPVPTANKINIWYDTDDGHLYVYNDDDSSWIRLTGYN